MKLRRGWVYRIEWVDEVLPKVYQGHFVIFKFKEFAPGDPHRVQSYQSLSDCGGFDQTQLEYLEGAKQTYIHDRNLREATIMEIQWLQSCAELQSALPFEEIELDYKLLNKLENFYY